MSESGTAAADTTTTTAATAATATTGTTTTAPAAGTGTMADTTTTAATTAAAPQDWPKDWRQRMAVGPDGKPDEGLSKLLERHTDPVSLAKKLREQDRLISQGVKPVAFPKDGKPEEQAAWRKERGLPEKPDGYKLPDTIKVSDQDKKTVEAFLTRAHGRNLDNDTVNDLTAWYFEARAEEAADRTVKDRETWTETERELRQKWGTEEFETNKAIYKNFLSSAPESVRDAINGARDANGRKLGGNPEFLEWAIGLARTVNPLHTVVPAGGTGGLDSVESEIAQIEKTMRDDRARYNADEGMQARLRKLYAARDAVKGKAA
jgi:hypothetical protein